ncbi:SH3 domain-containing protein [bacterium]|nr:SH3 domain-containing protein [bacterium]
MGKIKKLSLVIIVLSVVFLGVMMGQKALKFLEEKTLPPQVPPSIKKTEIPQFPLEPGEGTVHQTLYSSSETSSSSTPNTSQATSNPSNQPASISEKSPSSVISSISVNNGGSVSPTSPPFSTIASGEKWVAYVAGSGVNVREGPSTEAKLLFKVALNTKGSVVERKNGWTQIKWDFNRKIGWVRDDLLNIGPETVMSSIVGTLKAGKEANANIASITAATMQAAARKAAAASKISVVVAKPAPPSETVRGFSGKSVPKEGLISANLANVRSKPSTKAPLLGTIPKGVNVQIKSNKLIGKRYWFEIIYHNGRKIGWTREDNLQF